MSKSMSKRIHAERMNKVVQFIESNLDLDINVSQLALIACYSEFHFHRLFLSYVGESVYAYKKRLLLERSIRFLMHSDDSITDIAFNCGYSNQSSFNKAFKKQFSFSPSQVRKQMVSVATSKVKLTLNESLDMKAEIVDFKDTKVICARKTGTYSEAAPEAWQALMTFVYSNKLMGQGSKMIGISHDDPAITDANQIRYDACLDIDTNIKLDEGLSTYTVKGGRYAKFLHKGAYEGFQKSYAYIFNEWLPESDYKLRDEPCFDLYLNKDPRRTKPENLRTEIHIPIE